MSLRERARGLENRFYAAIRHPAVSDVARATPHGASLRTFVGHRHCLVVSYRRDGRPVATPVWFARDGDRILFETDADSLKVKRIGRNGRVRVAPCTVRGRPLAPPVEGRARILDVPEARAAERALDVKYGLARRITARLRPTPPDGLVYVEVRPA